MAKCPTCGETIDSVDAEMIDLNPSDAVEATEGESSKAIATVCPSCEAIIGI